MNATPRVAILGLHLECNAFAPVSERADFLTQCWEEGEAISTLARGVSNLPSEVPGFYARMDALGAWQPVPLMVIAAPPGGPASADVWHTFLESVDARLRAALPVDAVYVANHGASSAQGEDDTEGALARRLRAIVGPDVPIIATHDMHCNVSDATIDALDVLIPYRTNPHVDQRERAAEAADILHEIWRGMTPTMVSIRLPLTPPSVTLSTHSGPYAEAIAHALTYMQGTPNNPIINASVCAGFVFADLPKCGMTVVVTSRNDVEAATRAARDIAGALWANHGRFVADTLDVAAALERARTAQAPLLFADVADNPGGGGRGNTTWLLEAFDQARIPNVVLGVFVSPELAAQAHELAVGDEFQAVFNASPTPYSRRYEARARVCRLSDGEGTGRRGILQGRKFSLGPSALIELVDSGMRIVVGSLRRQLAEPAMLEMFGIDIAQVGCLIVKSRGHYRAGFDEFFSNDRITDVDSPGLTTPNITQIDFKHLPRPVWPLDPDVQWAPDV